MRVTTTGSTTTTNEASPHTEREEKTNQCYTATLQRYKGKKILEPHHMQRTALLGRRYRGRDSFFPNRSRTMGKTKPPPPLLLDSPQNTTPKNRSLHPTVQYFDRRRPYIYHTRFILYLYSIYHICMVLVPYLVYSDCNIFSYVFYSICHLPTIIYYLYYAGTKSSHIQYVFRLYFLYLDHMRTFFRPCTYPYNTRILNISDSF